ncbi:MAG: GAF domain-containing protein [Chloroflexi bacterium]|nr:GAF domain-containing protein [Chloroflexota bacterium]
MQRSSRFALRVALLYLLFGALWLLFAGRILTAFLHDPDILARLDSIQGWAFVVSSTTLLYIALRRELQARERSEDALRQSEARFLTAAESLPFDFWACDEEGRYILQNSASIKQWGNLLGKRPEETGVPGHILAEWHKVNQRALGGEIVHNEVDSGEREGRKYYYDIVAPIIDGARIHGILGVSIDLTDRKLAEAKLTRHVQQMAALTHIGQAVLASLDLARVLEKVVDEVYPFLQAEGVSILLREGENELVFAASKGAGAGELIGQRIPASAGVAGEVARAGRSVQITDEQRQTKIYRDIEKVSGVHVQSLLAVPLVLGSEVIGVIEAVHSLPQAFTGDDLSLLEAAANWAVLAIGNAREHKRTQRQLQESEVIAAISRALNETLDLQYILQLIVDAARYIIPKVDRAVIHLQDENALVLRAAAVATLVEVDRTDFVMRPGEGIAGQVMAEGAVINVADTRADPRYLPLSAGPQLRSLLVAPVESGARRLGTLSITSAAPHAFSSDDERLLVTLGVQTGLAIENARLFEDTRRQLNELTVLHSVATAGAESTSEDALIERVTHIIGGILYPDNFGILLLDTAAGLLRTHPSYRQTELSGRQPDIPLGQGIIGAVAASGQSRRVGDVTRAPEYINVEPLTRSELCAPLRVGERIIGVINAESTRPEAFSETDERLLVTLAGQLATAIEKVRLYNNLAQALAHEKAIRNQLVQAEKLAAMGRLIASVAHELNNPLQAIQNALYLVKQEPALGRQAREDLQAALAEADRMAGLIARLRETYRPTTGEDLRPESLNTLVREVEKLINTHLRQNGVTLDFTPDPDMPLVLGIRDHLKQVILNLCLNAVEAMPNGGQLSVSTGYEPDTGFAVLTVRDTGAGIDAEILPNVFDPFFTTKEHGTGLGLAITYEIISRHNGRIDISSQHNRGTEIKVWLPVKGQ